MAGTSPAMTAGNAAMLLQQRKENDRTITALPGHHQRKRTHAEVADRAARIAGGLQRLGVKPGDSVCILMRNDIAFIEAAYAVMRLGAYAVPVNRHLKADVVDYVLK